MKDEKGEVTSQKQKLEMDSISSPIFPACELSPQETKELMLQCLASPIPEECGRDMKQSLKKIICFFWYSPDEIEHKVSMFRKMLMEKEGVNESVNEQSLRAKEAHCTSDNSYDKNFKQHESFRLHEYNASNSAICLDRKLREHQGQTAITVHKKYSISRESSVSSGSASPQHRCKRKSRNERKKQTKEKISY
ncbi:uncharacterized protein LOC115224531 [Octopus sinensis]|uniref:Uncharacterized protein LOC115224531 n=1 Tax=Octopus sinensis TaxID=2607531 RepID=A0A7E6FNY9_9MOLL|nr:uncharacterized protein LOC115224531 [Octopus sinensis]